jgi:peptidyl-prolyl cis-trans isomerase D
MLDIVRANKKSIFTWIIVAGIVFIFAVNFGPGSLSKQRSGCSGGSGPAAYAARVNGQVIPANELELQAKQLASFYQQQLGGALPAEAEVALRRQALEMLVDRELTVQEAARRGIVVTDAEVSRTLYRMPMFQGENGQFSRENYDEYVRSQYGSAAKFEELVRESLVHDKMIAVLTETVKVSDAEVRDAWRSGADRVSLTFVRFPVAAAQAEVKVTDADAKAFAEKEGARIEAFYKENPDRFDQKKRAQVRHILARVAPDAGADADAAARKNIEAAAARVKAGEDFAKVAREVSDDANTKDRGGDLGIVAEGLADEAFAKAALALEQGQVSEPVRTASGWHLVKADAIFPARTVPLEAARLDIARELLAKERATKLARDRAQAALDGARAGKGLAEAFPPQADADKAKRNPVTLGGVVVAADETGAFAAGSAFVPKLGAAPELAQAATAAKAGEVLPKVYDTADGPVVAAVKLRERPDEKAFDQQREDVARRLRNGKLEQVRRAWLKELRDGAKVESNDALLAGFTQAQG